MRIRNVELVGDELPARDVVVDGSIVTRVGDDTVGPSTGAAGGGTRIEAREELIAFPGITNSHDHLEFNLYPPLGHGRYADYVAWGPDIHRRDRELIAAIQRVPLPLRVRWGVLKNLLCGVSTVAHHGDPFDAVRTAPVATVRCKSIHSVHFGGRWRLRLNGPVDRSPYVAHVGEGTSALARREVGTLLRWNLFRRTLVGVHAVAMRPDQAARFRALVWCPVSNEFLYGAHADVAAWKSTTTVLFGTDSTLTADWNFWSHLRRARALGPLRDRELFESITRAPSVVWGAPGRGRIAPGAPADLVVARKKARDRWDAFFSIDPEDILLVLKDGEVVLCDASIDARMPEPSSVVRIGATEKRVAIDVPALVRGITGHGVALNLPVTPGPRS